MTLALFIIAMIVGLCVAHVIGDKIPHRPAPQEVKQIRLELVEDAWSSLLDLDDDPNWKPEVRKYKMEEYKEMRERKLSDWVQS